MDVAAHSGHELKRYIAIDLKSFYASVECVDRGLDPLSTNLIVADPTRSKNTICLAVSPPLKELGVPGRPRYREVEDKVAHINAERFSALHGRKEAGSSHDYKVLLSRPDYKVDYIVAPPRMARYMEVSRDIYEVYLRYIAPEDILVYSIDEVFIDAGPYLSMYRMSARELAMKLILEVLKFTGITATAGIGTNLYLAKIAMDINAKHMRPDENGVRIAELDEMDYRLSLWDHRPITDFWMIGRGIARRLQSVGLVTMGDIALCSEGKSSDFYNEDLLYRLFGVNAELLIDHAWGHESCTMAEIRAYQPKSHSLSNGQVLMRPYSFTEARNVISEMADTLSLDLTSKELVADQVTVTVAFDSKSLEDPQSTYTGALCIDRYGKPAPSHAHGSFNLAVPTASVREITHAALSIFDARVDPAFYARHLWVAASHVLPAAAFFGSQSDCYQLELFEDEGAREARMLRQAREQRLQRAVLSIKGRYGKNAILRGINFRPGATAIERNRQIGGHRA